MAVNVVGEAVITIGAQAPDFEDDLQAAVVPAAEDVGERAGTSLGRSLSSSLAASRGTIATGLTSALGSISSVASGASTPIQELERNMLSLGTAAGRAGTGMDGFSREVRSSGEVINQSSGNLSKLREGFDEFDTLAMGFNDTVTGVQDLSTAIQSMFTSQTDLSKRVNDATIAHDAAVKKYGETSKQAVAAQKELTAAEEAQEAAAGTLGDKILMLGQGTSDMASGFANFIVPLVAMGVGLKSLDLSIVTTTASTIAQTVATTAQTVATNIMAAAQWALNAALSANPIALVVIAIAALVAGLVLAYQNSETFRNIVTAAWAAVQAAISAVANWVMTTVVPWLVSAWNTISAGASALGSAMASIWASIMASLSAVAAWITTTFGPTFNTLKAIVIAVFQMIEIAILAWWKLVIIPCFTAVQTALIALGTYFQNLYNTYVAPVFTAISNAAKSVFQATMQAVSASVTATLNALGAVFTWLYTNAVKPAWDLIVGVVKTGWALIQAEWNLMTTALKALGALFTSVYTSYIKPAWDSVSSVIQTGWNSTISPAFTALKTGVSSLGDAFSKAVTSISAAWTKVQDVTKVPIRFVLETVLNNGLIKGFNQLSKDVGGPTIQNVPMPFATGGVLPGYTPGRDVHQFYSPTAGSLALSGGEAIMRPEFTRAVGGSKGVAALNMMARTGSLGSTNNVGAFATGGVVSNVGSWIKKQSAASLNWVTDTASATYKAFADPKAFLSKMMPTIPGAGVVTKYATGAATKALTSTVDKVKSMFTEFKKAYDENFAAPTAAVGGGNVTRWSSTVLQALSMLGLPASLLNTVLAQITTESGGNPNAVQGNIGDINNKTGNLARGLMQVIPPTFAAYHVGGTSSNIFDPLANIAAGLNYADKRYGGAKGIAATLGHGHGYSLGGVFKPLLFDQGGILPTGVSAVVNNTGKPEPLYPESQSSSSSDTFNVTVNLSMESLAQLHTVDEFLKMLDNARADSRKTLRSGTTAN